MKDGELFNECLVCKNVWVVKNSKLRQAKIVACHYDIKFGETERIESSLIEYQDDHSKELLYPNEYTFNLKFALQKLINETNQTIKHLEEQLKNCQQRMEELGGFKSCFLVEESKCLGYYLKSKCQDCSRRLQCASI